MCPCIFSHSHLLSLDSPSARVNVDGGSGGGQLSELLTCAGKRQSATLPGPLGAPWVLAPGAHDQGQGGSGGPDASLSWRAGGVAPGKPSKEMTSECLEGAERELTSPGRKGPAPAKAWQRGVARRAQDTGQAAERWGHEGGWAGPRGPQTPGSGAARGLWGHLLGHRKQGRDG